MPLWMLCLNPWIVDGDSLRCSNLGEIRLLGVDAPDYRSSRPCRGGFGDHVCDDAGAKAAKRSLIALKYGGKGQQWRVRGFGRDRYGRLLARVRVGNIDLACYQLDRKAVRYIRAYDKGAVVAETCAARSRKPKAQAAGSAKPTTTRIID